ncbi:persephin isoform X2 [Sceloporus undulatus]|uniref:persephin isoform X2 n=1 Tax=Sceloporus undulatus TaxID=8520 RepID=UPI001C4D09C2|nr:persephin isoform X2 [Sceloporus undulatus]
MGAPQLFSSLFLFLLIQTISAWTTEKGRSLMMQESKTGTRDVLRMLLEAWTSKGAPVNAAGLQSSPLNYPPGSMQRQARSRPKRHIWERPEESECRLRSVLVRIKDLGLGYNSEETILFKYCSGNCPKARSNHDLTLSSLLQNSEIPALGDPCCRPTHYEDVAFLDDNHQWHEVEKLSASACSCVG